MDSAKALPEGRTGRVVPVSQLRCTIAKFARQRRGLCGATAKGRGQTRSAYVRWTMYNTHDGGKCVWTARMRCPGGANRQGGAGESIWEVSARCAGSRSGHERDVVKPCADAVTKEREEALGSAYARFSRATRLAIVHPTSYIGKRIF